VAFEAGFPFSDADRNRLATRGAPTLLHCQWADSAILSQWIGTYSLNGSSAASKRHASSLSWQKPELASLLSRSEEPPPLSVKGLCKKNQNSVLGPETPTRRVNSRPSLASEGSHHQSDPRCQSMEPQHGRNDRAGSFAGTDCRATPYGHRCAGPRPNQPLYYPQKPTS